MSEHPMEKETITTQCPDCKQHVERCFNPTKSHAEKRRIQMQLLDHHKRWNCPAKTKES